MEDISASRKGSLSDLYYEKYKHEKKILKVQQQCENVLIKRLAKRAEIDRIVYTSCVVEKKYREGEFELHQTITTHDARQTFTSICYREFTLSLEEVRELLQHSSTDQTLEYIYIGASVRSPKIWVPVWMQSIWQTQDTLRIACPL